MRKLVIGSLGWDKHPDIVRVDIVSELGDICCDIRKGIPLTEEFDEINCSHVLKHIQLNEDYQFVMWELYRLLKKGGELYIEVPHKDTQMAYESFQHTRFFVNNSFTFLYNEPYHKELNVPQFKLKELHNGTLNGEKTVCVTLIK